MCNKRGGSLWHTSSQDQLWKVLGAGQSILLGLQLFDLIHQPVDPILDLLGLSLVLAWTGFPTYIGPFEGIDVVIEFGLNHVSEILVIKLFDVAGLAALDLIIVKIDLDLTIVVVVEDVEVLGFA